MTVRFSVSATISTQDFEAKAVLLQKLVYVNIILMDLLRLSIKQNSANWYFFNSFFRIGVLRDA